MSVSRNMGNSQFFQQIELIKSRGEEVISPKNMRHPHRRIIDGYGELISDHAIGTPKDKVIYAGTEHACLLSAEKISEGHAAFLHTKAPGGRLPLFSVRDFFRAQTAAVSIIDRQSLSFMRRRGDAVKTGTAAEAGIDLPRFFPPIHDFLIERKSETLDGRPIRIAPAGALVVGKTHPCEVFFDSLYVFRVASLPVDVFDTQHDRPSMLACPEPVQKSDPDIPKMHISRGARRKAGTNGCLHSVSLEKHRSHHHQITSAFSQ